MSVSALPSFWLAKGVDRASVIQDAELESQSIVHEHLERWTELIDHDLGFIPELRPSVARRCISAGIEGFERCVKERLAAPRKAAAA